MCRYVRKTPHNFQTSFAFRAPDVCAVANSGIVRMAKNFQALVHKDEILWLAGRISQDPVSGNIFVFREFSYDGTRAIHRVDFKTGLLNQSWVVNNHGNLKYDDLSELKYMDDKIVFTQGYDAKEVRWIDAANPGGPVQTTEVTIDGEKKEIKELRFLALVQFMSWREGDDVCWGQLEIVNGNFNLMRLAGDVPVDIRPASTDGNFFFLENFDQEDDDLLWRLLDVKANTMTPLKGGGPELLCVIEGKLVDLDHNEEVMLQ